ncbi:response regulator transcription factor [Oceanirhabdus seepicola]|uniref:Stage 0 sporulation protein A homolog n=1 Tax=Oceanirhabdus seepicola TaxID=2828781 RepID=A0A9J6NW99_9CLOT|nr:helix-turn-helix domain-containing protein [Oceanirhabdus seepicola]MCM1988201.1 response regulator [Oceanirhabdus seepicola]
MYSIVIVDDEPLIAKGIERSCRWEKFGARVDLVSYDPEEAYEYILANKPEIVFTDINMGDVSGIELMKRVRVKGINSEFVVISGYSDFEYVQDAMKYNAFYYLLKPIDKDELRNIMSNLILKIKGKFSHGYIKEVCEDEVTLNDNKDNDKFKEILTYIQDNYTNQLSLPDIADKFFYNPTYISDLIKRTLGKNFTEYVLELRIEKACLLLSSTKDSISSIAAKCGYSDYCYFTKQFKKITGMTPSAYRKES